MNRRGIVFLGLVSACSSGAETQPAEVATYHRDVRPLIEQACGDCHAADGIGPFRLDSYESLKAAAAGALDAIENRRMPPWMPDPDCRRYVGERLLSDQQIALFRAWVDGGTVEGDPAEYVAPTRSADPVVALGPADLTLGSSVPYVPSAERPDDYRCFVLDADFSEETFLTASNVLPDQQAIVHHVILYLVAPQEAERVAALDAADEGPGYTCFGGTGVGQPTPISGWVPGTTPNISGDNSAIRIPAGAKLVLQMHYNLLASTPAADQTQVQLWTTTERPDTLLLPQFLPNLGIDIAAGDSASTHARRITNNSGQPWTVVQTTPHMHLLGTRISTWKVAADGQRECMVDIPRWDFNWQQGYAFRPGEEVVVQPGESIELECTYDNSAANQPIVNGVQLDPVRVTWGEGTLDEMCLNSLVFAAPYFETPTGGSCDSADFQPCYDECMRGLTAITTGCVLQCGASNGCAECALTGMISCTTDTCGQASTNMLTCLEDCNNEADCVATRCLVPIVTFDRCVAPSLAGESCVAARAGCEIEL